MQDLRGLGGLFFREDTLLAKQGVLGSVGPHRFGMRHAMAIASFVASEGASAGHGLYRLWDAVVPGQSVRKS